MPYCCPVSLLPNILHSVVRQLVNFVNENAVYFFSPLSFKQKLNMGTSESKMAVVSTPKPDPIHQLKNQRLAQLADPRSPSCEINRTPIQVTPNRLVMKMHLIFSVPLNLDINRLVYPCVAV